MMKNIFGMESKLTVNPSNTELYMAVRVTSHKILKLMLSKGKGLKELPLNSKIDDNEKSVHYKIDRENNYTKCSNELYNLIGVMGNLKGDKLPNKWFRELNRYSSKISKLEQRLKEEYLYAYDIGIESPINKELKCVSSEYRQDGTIINVFEEGKSSVITSNRRLAEYSELNANMFEITTESGFDNDCTPSLIIKEKSFKNKEERDYNNYKYFAYIVSDSFKTLTRAMGIIETNYPAQFLNFTEENDMESITPLRRFKDNHIVCLQCARLDIVHRLIDILEGNFRYLAFRRIVPAEGETIFTNFTGDDSFNYDEVFTGENALSDIYNECIKELG